MRLCLLPHVLLVVLALPALACADGDQPVANSSAAGQEKRDPALFPTSEIRWQKGPASLPRGAWIAVLEGDPGKPGPFVFRIKVPDGYRVPPHIHKQTERVTVLAGTFHLGMGDTFDDHKAQRMPAGTYGQWPAGMKHYAWVQGETILQFHGMGPWSIEYVRPEDDPRTQK